MKASLVSFFNTSNIGDLLISRALKKKVEKYATVDAIDYLGNHEVKSDVFIENKTTEQEETPTNVDKVKEIIWKTLYKLRLESFILLYHSYFNKIQIPNVEESIKSSEALIIGGGNMIFDLMPSSLSASRFDYFVSTAKKYNKKVFAISLGIGPFQNNYQKKQAVNSLAKCDYITFRDKKSYEIFRKEKPEFENAYIVADPVFFAEPALSDNMSGDSIGINIINPNLFPSNYNYEEVINNYSILIDKIIESTNREVVIFNTESKDYEACMQVYNKCKNKTKLTIQEVKYEKDLYEVYSKCDLIIGTRMHSLITAFAQGIPIIGFSWQQKVDAMFEMIEDTESVFDLFELSTHYEEILEKCESKLKDDGSTQRKEVMEKLLQKEEINNNILQNIFSSHL
ncbi:polysaccharide pyruvyl transferase family protein [Desemzia incerta]|uniref:polysaccharide pyruvyl transferase family protein n=1 Tax=Desemzia incerta TaxID=82801 RepID=UPI0016617CCB|nr:polysaccharide pyruvyl transferase family protein [Desemzia incerta]